jgi:drug/metabolite transporter (DMT)-like permease
VPVALGLLAAIAYGSADFIGGFVSRRNGAIRVVLLSQVFGLLLMLPFIPVFTDRAPEASELWWGVGAGMAGGVGVLFLFRGLSIGRMSVVAPITGIVAPAVPVFVGVARGERPGLIGAAGVVLALAAVWLVSRSSETDEAMATPPTTDLAKTRRPEGVLEAFGAGVAFGAFFVLLDQSGSGIDPSLWPLVGTRIGSISLVGTLALATRTHLRPERGTEAGIASSGCLDVAANGFYYLAAQEGLLSLTAVITSMYPGMTVLLARAFLREHLKRSQIVGLLVGAVGVVFITLA